MFESEGRVIMVTGPAGNLGRAVVENLLEAGARLILVDRAKDRLSKLYPELVDNSDHFLAHSVDVSDLDAVDKMVEASVDRFGHIDGLVNTVGSFRSASPLEEECLDHWHMMLEVNAYTTLVACRSVIPRMIKNGRGKVVNVGSRLALKAGPRTTAYSAAKSAVLRITESLSEEVKELGVNVNCILPGTIDTPQNRQQMPDADFTKWTSPQAIADVIRFLLSDAASCLHGASIPAYGLS